MVQQKIPPKLTKLINYFNTSYVMVQQTSPPRGGIFIVISIHLMLWFNNQVISKKKSLHNFNTSYVMVQPLLVCDCYFLLY